MTTPAVLIGREREVAALTEAWAAAASGSGRIVVADGEAGVGKTALAVALRASVERSGRVVWVPCVERAVPPPQGVVRAILDELAAPAGATEAAASRRASGRARQGGDGGLTMGDGGVTGTLAGTEGSGGSGDPDADARLAAVADVFARELTARAEPCLVVVDDAQWADEVSLRVLGLAAPQLVDAPVLVVATLRTGESLPAARRAAVAALLRAASRLPVLPLDSPPAHALALAAAPRPLPARVLADVERRAAGNPLFLRELAVLACLDPDGARDASSLPDTVRSVVDRRLAALPREERAVVEDLAVCGDDLPWTVAAAAVDVAVDDLLAAVGPAVDADVLQSPATGRVRFTHPLVRDALVAGVPYARRIRLHQRIGHRLAMLVGEGGHVDASVVAGHLCEAAAAGGAADAVHWAVRAAEEASARLAHASAAAWYERALAALDLDPSAADRLSVMVGFGAALDAAGDREAAGRVFTEAFGAARHRGDPVEMARAALGVAGGGGFEIPVADPGVLAVLDEAIAAVGDTDLRGRALLLARRSVVAALREPEHRRRAAAEQALALARATADPGAQCAALSALCDAAAGPADAERRLALAEEMSGVARRAGDPRSLLLALRLAAVAHLERGDMVAFDETVDGYESVAATVRQPVYEWYVPLWRGMRRAMAADVEGARELADEAEVLGLAADSGNARMLVSCLRAFLAVDVADRPNIRLPDASALSAMIGPWEAIATAYLSAAGGDLEAARRVADRLPVLLEQLPVDSEYLPAVVQAARIVGWLGGHPSAGILYDRLVPHAGRFVVEGIGAYTHGPVDRFLALLARVLGRPEEAAHRRAAQALLTAAGAPLLLRVLDEEAGVEGPAGGRAARPGAHGVFRRDGDGWLVALGDERAHVRDAKGMRDLAVLVGRPRHQVAAADLAGRAGGVVAAPGGRAGTGRGRAERDPGRAGGVSLRRGDDVLDERAKREYRQRLADLDAEVAEAEADADVGRREKAVAERDFLVAELTRALGLGGRSRRVGDDVERARSTVTARIRDAIRRIDAASPTLGEHLRRSVRTGTYCSYDPPDEVTWEL